MTRLLPSAETTQRTTAQQMIRGCMREKMGMAVEAMKPNCSIQPKKTTPDPQTLALATNWPSQLTGNTKRSEGTVNPLCLPWNTEIKCKPTCCCYLLSCVQLFATPWTMAHQAPLSMGFSRQEYWSGVPFPPPGDLHDPGIEAASPALIGGFFTAEPLGKPENPLNILKTSPSMTCQSWHIGIYTDKSPEQYFRFHKP